MLTKKHFRRMAKELNDARQCDHMTVPQAVYTLALGLAKMCAESNPQFDKTRFMEACGFES